MTILESRHQLALSVREKYSQALGYFQEAMRQSTNLNQLLQKQNRMMHRLYFQLDIWQILEQ